jgi:hypothetical protein
MWIRMSDQELVDARKKRKRADRTIVCGVALMGTVIVSATPRIKSGDPHLASLNEFLANYAVFFLPTLVLVAIVYYLGKRGRRREVICPKCDSTKYDDGLMHCSCGGEFDYLAEMKWVEFKEKRIAE